MLTDVPSPGKAEERRFLPTNHIVTHGIHGK